jgi:hypothetical protein
LLSRIISTAKRNTWDFTRNVNRRTT